MIGRGKLVKVDYRVSLEGGAVIGTSFGGEPLAFRIGSGEAIEGLERAVADMEVGERRVVKIPPELAYGDYDPKLKEEVLCESFPNWEKLSPGRRISLQTADGPMSLKVESIEDGVIVFDKNHELAGRQLEYEIELLEVEGERPNLVRREHGAGCACGCDRLKNALDPIRRT